MRFPMYSSTVINNLSRLKSFTATSQPIVTRYTFSVAPLATSATFFNICTSWHLSTVSHDQMHIELAALPTKSPQQEGIYQ